MNTSFEYNDILKYNALERLIQEAIVGVSSRKRRLENHCCQQCWPNL